MRITDAMIVPNNYSLGTADTRKCTRCGGLAFFTPQEVMVFSTSGARKMRLWTCEVHRLPDTITDDPESGWGK